jgi:uncharacterized protein YbjT (DUF2867 family)
VTRHPESEKAAALRQAGAEVVAGDLADPESLRSALVGCYGCYGVTNFWEHFERERDLGRNLIETVADAELEHFVFSTLPSVIGITGEMPVPHFDIKADLEAYARARVRNVTFVQMAFYFENFLGFFPPRRQEDGTYAFGFPGDETPLAGVGTEDIGGVVAAIFERREEFLGQTVYIVGDDIPPARYAEVMSRTLGVPVKFNRIPRDVFASFGFPSAVELANMFEFYRAWVPNRRAEMEQTRALYPAAQTFEQWAARHREELARAAGM